MLEREKWLGGFALLPMIISPYTPEYLELDIVGFGLRQDDGSAAKHLRFQQNMIRRSKVVRVLKS